MKTRINPFLRAAVLPAIVSLSFHASDASAQSIKADNALPLDDPASWTNTSVPAGALGTWDNIVTTANTTTIGAGVAFSGISITDPSGNVAINAGSGGTLTLGSGGIDMTSSDDTLTLGTTISLGANQTWKTGVSGVAGSVQISSSGVISGSGKLSLSSSNTRSVALNAANVFTGGFTLNAGAIVTTGVAAVSSASGTTSSAFGTYDGSQVLTINGGRINSGNFAFHARNASIAGDFTFATTARTEFGGNIDLGGGTRTMTLTRGSTSAQTVTLGGNNALRFSGIATTGLATIGNGTLRLAADAAISTGNFVPVITNVGTVFSSNAGLVLGPKVVFSAASGSLNVAAAVPSVTLEAGSYWNLAEGTSVRNPQVNSLAGDGTVISLYTGATVTTAFTLTIKGNSGTSTDFSGAVVNSDLITFPTSTASIMGVTKAGNTTQILSGSNTYTGPTSVTGGKLVTTTKSNNGTFATSAGTTLGVKVDSAGTDLNVTGLTFATSTLEIDLNNLGNPTAPVISNSANTTLNGTVTVNVLNPALLTTGPITLVDTVGTRSGTGTYALGSLPAGVNATLSETAGDLILTINSISPIYQWTGATNTLWNSSPANVNWTKSGLASAYSDAPNYDAIFDDSATGSTSIDIAATVSPKSTTIDSTAKTYSLSGSGKISGTGGLTKKGSSTVTVSTANDYLGATNIDAGTFKLGSANVIPNGTVNLASTLDLAGYSDTVNALAGNGQLLDSTAGPSVLTVGNADVTSSFSGTATGTVGLAKSGAGTFTLTGTTSHGGATLVSGGTLEIGSGGASGVLSPSSVLTNNGTFKINRSTTTTQGTDFPAINGSGAVVKSGSGTTVFNLANGYAGLTTIESGSLALTVPGALGGTAAGTTALSGSSILLRNGISVSGETVTITGFGNGSRGVIRADGGDAVWAGNIVVASGSTDTRLGGSVAAGGTLTLSGTISGGDPTNITDANAAFNGYPVTVSVRSNDASDTLVLSGANSFNGNFGIFVGQVRLDGGNNRLPVTSRLMLGFAGTAPVLDLNGRSQQLAGLCDYQSGSGALAIVTNNSGTAATLTVNSSDTGTPAGAGLSADTTPTYTGALSGNLSFVKSGPGDLKLKASNSYSGSTTVSGGVLTLGDGTSSTTLDDSADVIIGVSGTLKLDYTGSDTIDQLTIAGVGKAPGVYGKPGSGAQFTDPQIDGTGTLTVTTGPAISGNYASWANDPLKGNIPGQPALGDFDFDGLSNITEYALGLNPRVSSVPPGTFSGGALTFTKGADAIANGDVVWVIEQSTSLTSWSPVVTQPNGNAAPSITYTLPAGQSKVFSRLKVTQVP
jgi:autotransporter-associated beta strand protein